MAGHKSYKTIAAQLKQEADASLAAALESDRRAALLELNNGRWHRVTLASLLLVLMETVVVAILVLR